MHDMKYEEGQRFRVEADGARFEGLLLFGEQSISGWSRPLIKGEILTCLGWNEVHALGSDIKGVMWTGLRVPENALCVQIWPFESIFRPHPLRGVLAPYVDADELEDQAAQAPRPTIEEIPRGKVVPVVEKRPLFRTGDIDDPDVVDLTGY